MLLKKKKLFSFSLRYPQASVNVIVSELKCRLFFFSLPLYLPEKKKNVDYITKAQKKGFYKHIHPIEKVLTDIFSATVLSLLVAERKDQRIYRKSDSGTSRCVKAQ